MDPFQYIYTHRAAAYHQMITAEDVNGNLLPALERVTNLEGKRILDLGSGTGRLPLLLYDKAAHIVALDHSLPMLQEQRIQRQAVDGDWDILQGDIRALPLPECGLDVALAGWVIGHLRSWFEAEWRTQITRGLKEMHRVVRPGGALIIMESLTTGSLTPAPPAAALGEYYDWLESQWGFERKEIRTDYQFSSIQEAVEKTEFFFGAELAEKIHQNKWRRVPEWTGVWGKMR